MKTTTRHFFRKSIFTVLVALILSQLSVAPASAQDINMQAIVYPPLVYEKDGDVYGIVPEVVRAIQKEIGDHNPLQVTPWLRGYNQAQTQERHALFAIVRIPKRENLFKWVGPVFSEGDYFFQRQGAGLTVKTLDDARENVRIAVRREGYTHQTLKAKGFDNLVETPSYEASYKMLSTGRVDLVLMGERTYYYMVKNAGLTPAIFERTDYKLDDSSAWLAFSKDIPDETIAKWQNALDKLKANGTYDAIMNRHFHP